MLAAFRILSALTVATLAYIWTVGQAGLDTANKNICQLANSFIAFSNCEVHYWFVGAWIAGTLCASAFIAFDFARFARRAATPHGGVVLFCRHYRSAASQRLKAGWSKVEPSHIIILGLAIALVGVAWQWRRAPSPDPHIATLQSEIGDLRKKLAEAEAPTKPGNVVAAVGTTKPQVLPEPSPIAESRLRLHFRPENEGRPNVEELLNIHRWYALNDLRDSKAWTLFVALDKPMNVAQVQVESNEKLPRYLVKDSDGRGAIIVFEGPITNAVMEIRLLATSDKVIARLEPPIPPTPRQLSPYEAETKLRAIDKTLKILTEDMQPLVDRFPLQQGWWNALKDPTNNPNFREDLLKFRDDYKATCLKLDTFRNSIPEYQDLVAMVAQPSYEKVLKSLEKYMIQFMYVQDTVKQDASKEALLAFMDDHMTDQYNAMNEFIRWRNETKERVLNLRRQISP
jgi:hypothetical protein